MATLEGAIRLATRAEDLGFEAGAEILGLAARLEAGVVVMPGSIFGAGGVGHVRLSCGAARDRIAEGLARLGAVLGEE